MATEYWEADDDDDVIRRAQAIIDAHHPHLTEARIKFVFRDPPAKSGGRTVLGKAKKLSAFEKMMTGGGDGAPDFAIVLWYEWWKDASESEKQALLDHELCHCRSGENGWEIRPHDIEDFVEIIARHGAWNAQALAMERAFQFDLFGHEGERRRSRDRVRDALGKIVPEDGSVTMSSGGKSVTLTEKDGKIEVESSEGYGSHLTH